MNGFRAMLIANLKMSVRNRAAFFWNILFPAVFILIFPALFSSGIGGTPSIGIAGGDTALRQQVTQALDDNGGFDLHQGSQDDELAALKDDDRDLVIVFPEGELSDATPIQLYTSSTGGPSRNLALASVRSALLGSLGVDYGIAITEQDVSTLDTSFVDFFVPGILAMSLMNAGMIGLATNFVSYRERGILRRIKVTPLPLWSFILTRIVASLVTMLISSLLLMVMGWIVWGLDVRGNWLLIIAMILIGSLAFLGIGYAIAAVSRTVEASAAYTNALTFPMLFLSGVFIPVSSMPGWLQPIATVLPLRYLVDALRDPIMYGRGLGDVWAPALVLIAIFAATFAFAIRFFRWDATAK